MNNKGITLVALVVTVIILIILASVSIVTLVGQDGLITKTKSEAATYDVEVIRDDVKLAVLNAKKYGAGSITEQNLTLALNNQLGLGNYTLTKNTETNNWIITVKDQNFEVGEDVFFDTNAPVQLSGDSLARKVKIGDYVAYNPTKTNAEGTESVEASKLTYTSNSNTDKANTSGNGYGTQTFTANANTKWKVLDKNETTGVVVLVSEAPILTDANEGFYSKGAKAYLYAEQELNEICKIYGYGYGANTSMVTTYQYGDEISDGGFKTGTITGSGARSINIEDINKIGGVDELQKRVLCKNYNSTYYGDKIIEQTVYYPTISTATGLSNSDEDRSYSLTSYSYTGRKYFPETGEEPYKMLFRNLEDTQYISYMIASRCVFGNYNGFMFSLFVANSGNIANFTYLDVDDDESIEEKTCQRGIRPVICLQETVETSGKNEAGAWVLK